jgi:hypothetical protein
MSFSFAVKQSHGQLAETHFKDKIFSFYSFVYRIPPLALNVDIIEMDETTYQLTVCQFNGDFGDVFPFPTGSEDGSKV